MELVVPDPLGDEAHGVLVDERATRRGVGQKLVERFSRPLADPSAPYRLRLLRPDHPELLLELAHDLDEHVLRRSIERSEAIHASPEPFIDLREALCQLANDDMIREGTAFDWSNLAAMSDRVRLAIGPEADRDGPLSDCVGKVTPRLDQLVQLEVKRAEIRSDHAPVELLAEQRQIDELDQRRL
jgi:hypothetical protein